MLKKILLAVVAIIVILAMIITMQPASYRIVRQMKIAAAPSVVYPLVDDFHAWEAWSPWAKLDPNMKVTYEGPAAGKGAVYKWVGNDKVGEGQMTILADKENQLVTIKLDFLKPFKDTSTTEFTLTPDGDGTNVTWTMSGDRNFLSKAICLFMNMDKLVGGDFEKGLAKLKTEAEAKAKK